jgi:hypothetical protein
VAEPPENKIGGAEAFVFNIFILNSRLLFLQKNKVVIFKTFLIPVSTAHALAAKPLLFIFPRMYVRRLFLIFTGFGGPATAFSACKVSAQKGLF